MPVARSHLKDLDYSVVQQCMHCGLCLPSCPTYDATRLERNSPRGRIALMRAIADGRLEPSRAFADEMYFCLGCLACMTACPAGVNYAELFEHARAEAEQSGVLRSSRRNLIRRFTLRWLFMDLARLHLAGRALRLYQELGLQTFARLSGLLNLLPKRLRELEAMTPPIQDQFSSGLISPLTRPIGGSLHAHNGEWELAQQLARKNLDQFPPEQFDAIITNAGGCGSHLKHYGKLLAGDSAYENRARAWDGKVKDIHEWLVQIGLQAPSADQPAQTVTYHESCHLCHGQKVTAQPRQLLKTIPNLVLVELPESSWCCGSAGIYNLIQPQMADALLERKLKHIRSTGAPVVATGNPGCLLQIINGAHRQGWNLRVAHPVTLLAEAYRRDNPAALNPCA